MQTKILIVFFFLLPMICLGQKKAYKIASKSNTIKSYTKFLEQYPNSKFSIAAKEKKANLCIDWEKQMNKSDINVLKLFLKACPETDNKVDIEAQIESLREDLEWNKAVRENTLDVFEVFRHNFPNSKRIKKAKNKIEDLEWKNTKEYDTKEAYNNFITRFPNSKRKKDADSILNILNTFALPRAAKKGNVEEVNSLITNADTDMKSRALMEAVWGALYTSPSIEIQKKNVNGYKYNDYVVVSKQSAKSPRQSYITIIKLLLKNKASPKHFAFENFRSVEVSKKARADELTKQVSKSGYGSVSQKIGGDINLNLIPFGTGGLSIKEVAEIHIAKDILILLKK